LALLAAEGDFKRAATLTSADARMRDNLAPDLEHHTGAVIPLLQDL